MKSDYDCTRMIIDDAKRDRIRRNMSGFRDGQPKKDPLIGKHKGTDQRIKKSLTSMKVSAKMLRNASINSSLGPTSINLEISKSDVNVK